MGARQQRAALALGAHPHRISKASPPNAATTRPTGTGAPADVVIMQASNDWSVANEETRSVGCESTEQQSELDRSKRMLHGLAGIARAALLEHARVGPER